MNTIRRIFPCPQLAMVLLIAGAFLVFSDTPKPCFACFVGAGLCLLGGKS